MTENELATIAVDICYKIHTPLGPDYWKVYMKQLLPKNRKNEISHICVNQKSLFIMTAKNWV